MNRNEVYHQIEERFGLVPTMFKTIPDKSLEQEWELFRMIELDDGPIPQKYRELIGVAVSAATKCRYCELFHTELAKLHGATEEEIESALHYVKHTTGWSTYVNGMQIDFDQFTAEVNKASEYVRNSQRKKAPVK
ncbi:MAG TPA: carboxymuconolactone decarboxylase family protein [Balneolales bacterium]|nr:carboxymuconolactone decarboxylase family protein [Balneolales bacterium]